MFNCLVTVCFNYAKIIHVIMSSCIIQGVETVDASHFVTPENIERLQQAKEANRVQVCILSSLITE